MNDRTVEYFLSPVSPYMYLGHARFVALAKAQGVTIAIKPVDLARVFPATGGLPLAKRAPARQAYRLTELKRWGDFLDVPIIVGKPSATRRSSRASTARFCSAFLPKPIPGSRMTRSGGTPLVVAEKRVEL